jgi:RNA polymerase sigma-70 factor (ECF subfamily)
MDMSGGDGSLGDVAPAISDHSLLRRLRHGQADAATELYVRYAERLNALAKSKSSSELARRVSSEEIVQSVFGSFFRGAQQGYYEIPVGEELWKLFLVMALNKIRAKGSYHLAAKRDSRLTQGSEILETLAGSDHSTDQNALSVLEMTIDETLAEMPQHCREMVTMRVEGYEVEEIARRTGRSKRTVERILQAIRQKLTHVLFEE